MPSVINGLSRTLLLKGKSKSINSFVSKGLYVYTLECLCVTSGSIQLQLK